MNRSIRMNNRELNRLISESVYRILNESMGNDTDEMEYSDESMDSEEIDPQEVQANVDKLNQELDANCAETSDDEGWFN